MIYLFKSVFVDCSLPEGGYESNGKDIIKIGITGSALGVGNVKNYDLKITELIYRDNK
jgi:hypothetical protein